MTTTPTPEDYQIGPEEALEINAKATQGEWQAHTQGVYDGTVISVTEDCIHHICIDPQYDDRPADRAAIAYNHNNTPGLARRLMELEEAAISWLDAKDNLNSADSSKMMATYGAYVDAGDRLSRLAERIKAGREAQNG